VADALSNMWSAPCAFPHCAWRGVCISVVPARGGDVCPKRVIGLVGDRSATWQTSSEGHGRAAAEKSEREKQATLVLC